MQYVEGELIKRYGLTIDERNLKEELRGLVIRWCTKIQKI